MTNVKVECKDVAKEMGIMKSEEWEIVQKEFEKRNRWLKLASTCEHIKEHEFISIPTFLPKCDLTNDACRYEDCPRQKEIG